MKQERTPLADSGAARGHVPVLLRETIDILAPRAAGRYVDGTLGGAGHAEAILDASSPDGELLGLDWDGQACARATARLARFGSRVTIRRSSFADLGVRLEELGWDGADGILLDLGVSSFHLDTPERGFSFSRPGPLDMRMDQTSERSAALWLRTVDEEDLVRALRDYGEERHARRVARAIVGARRRGELRDTADLAAVVARAVPRPDRDRHPATLSFQAIRIAVNRELDELDRFLEHAYRWLRPRGRLVILAYHSLEDRRVKRAFQKWARPCVCPRSVVVCRCGWSRQAVPITRRAVTPTAEEVARNPRSRSARLRAVERIAA